MEQRIPFALTLLVIAVVYSRHKLSMQALKDNAWDALLPWIVLLCLFFVLHVLAAAVRVYKDEQQSHASPIILTDRHSEPIIPPTKFRLGLYGSTFLLLIIPILFSYLTWSKATESTQQVPPSAPQPVLAIFAKCDRILFSVEIPPHDAIRIVPVNEKGMRLMTWGSYEIRNDTDSPTQWPGKEKILQARREHDPGGFGYRCEISNHGEVNVLDVAIPIQFWFSSGDGQKKTALIFSPIISPLDVGKTFTLYFANDCPTLAIATLPDYASAFVVGEATRRYVKLNLPNRNPVERIMAWDPTNIKWVGSNQCG
jgi:hypothetical protein